MHIGTIAAMNLWRRPMRSLLTALGIAVSAGSFVCMIGLSRGLDQSWVHNLMARGTHLLAIQKGAVEILTTSVKAHLGEAICRVEGVRDVAAELGDVMPLEDGQTTVAVGWPPECFLWNSIRLVEGRLPDAGEDEVVLLGQAAAKALNKKPGDSLSVRYRQFRIVGVFHLSGVMGNNSTILPLATMQDIMGRQGMVTGFHIRVAGGESPAVVADVRTRLEEAFPGLTFAETSTAPENDMVLRLFNAVAWMVSMIAVVIALLIVLNTLLMSVIERTHEIGILAAVGWTTARIVGMIVLEGTILAFAGGALGLAAGVGGLQWLTAFPKVRGIIEPAVDFRILLEVLAAAAALGGLGSLYPAWRAAKLNITEALRYE